MIGTIATLIGIGWGAYCGADADDLVSGLAKTVAGIAVIALVAYGVDAII